MAHIQEKGWFFLIRIKDGRNGIKMGLELPRRNEFDLDVSLKLTRKQTNDVKKLLKDKNLLASPQQRTPWPVFQDGRCSNYILKDRKDTLNFFVYAPEEVRIQATMEKKNIGRKEAAELVKYHDEMLHSRYKYMTGSYRGDRKGRHMMIDSSVLGWEKTAQYMLQMIDLRFED